MLRYLSKSIVLAVLPASCLMADFSYEQTTKITGGAVAGMMKVAGAFSKQMREPVRTTIAVKGDRMVHLFTNQASIYDLSNETITEIDFQKKQYSVMTFAELTKMMQELTAKNKDKQGVNMQFKVDVKDTGQSKQIAGYNTKQVIMKIIMEGQVQEDSKQQKVNMMMTIDSWMAPRVAGYEEITAFQKRMAEKLNFMPGGGMASAMGGADMGKAMAQAMKEGSKLDGMPVFQTVSMGAEGMQGQGGGAAAEGQPAQPQQQQQAAQAEKPSAGSALGGALGGRLGRLGGLGGLGRKKKQEDPPAQQPAAEQQQAQAAPAQPAPSGALMEATSEMSGFSSAAVDAAKFQVPAGFKQVQPDKRIR